MITLDGSRGGGQILRTALSLSLITGKPFRIHDIRGKRPKPGLKRQHLTCVQAALQIGDGSADGAELNSRELVFHPGTTRAGDYRFAIGTAGSTSLLLQTVLPALLFADGASTVHVTGGTHNPLAPTADFIARSFLPALRTMGAGAGLTLHRHGFAPAGGGHVELAVNGDPNKTLKPLPHSTRGDLTGRHITATYANLDRSIAGRMATAAAKNLGWPEDSISVNEVDADGPGATVTAEAVHGNITDSITYFAERGRSADKLGHLTGRDLTRFLESGALVTERLADQLLLPLALAGGGTLTTTNATNHINTNLHTIAAFLATTSQITQPGADTPCTITIAS